MIPNEILQKLLDNADVVCYEGESGEDIDFDDMAKELLTLRREKQLLIAIADKMAQILSDGEGKADQICCVDYYHARDAIYEYAELSRKVKGE